MPSVLLLGATGLIGSRLAIDLKKAYPEWPLTVLLRNTNVDEWFKVTAKVDRIVHGTISDTELVRSLSKEHDIVINSVTSFDGDFVKTIIAGMEERPEHSKGTLIHISGTGNFIDHGKSGSFNPNSKVWNDDNEDDIRKIVPTMFNGPTDVPVLEAGELGKIVTYIVCFAMTYGSNIGPVPNLGVAYNILTSNAKQLGFAPYVGDGSAKASLLHVGDGVPFVTKIVGIAGTEKPSGSAYSRYYILHGERVAWKELSSALAKVLHAKGVVASPEPKSVPSAEAGQGEIGSLIAANMLVKGDRAVRLGFKATHPSVLVQMQEDLGAHDF
ncbi:uncharacterized protein Z520_10763 [Fonsecaea multimorphosa CBS 102226]|uniref:NAD(P)-binding domain-containing protein n=1 Tax=Fonsecaea multimorphosa CBS 102226 TaxID=1442371 RepID=A0A0D2GVG2_9EURO|nr:uncharacterized protein Z520_10763 [Fonsecaea multimorphosa CBS 102226]KIX93585.1 hypothetical protein Z520_10763 [Fonsecaea multimorphosa CBS 102226]OAL18897.1 hypothetical protein AYO22_10226 [Fonsecaea multimorphosa]